MSRAPPPIHPGALMMRAHARKRGEHDTRQRRSHGEVLNLGRGKFPLNETWFLLLEIKLHLRNRAIIITA